MAGVEGDVLSVDIGTTLSRPPSRPRWCRRKKKKKALRALRDFSGGALAESLATLLTYRWDSLKVRSQVQTSSTALPRLGLTRGIRFACGQAFVFGGLYWLTFRSIEYGLKRAGLSNEIGDPTRRSGDRTAIEAGVQVDNKQESFARTARNTFIKCTAANFICSVLETPFDVVRMRMQSGRAKRMNTMGALQASFQNLQMLHRSGGAVAVLGTFSTQLTKALPYEWIEFTVQSYADKGLKKTIGRQLPSLSKLSEVIPISEILSGAVSGVVATVVTMPADVMRSQILVDATGSVSVRKRVLKMLSTGTALRGLKMRLYVNGTSDACPAVIVSTPIPSVTSILLALTLDSVRFPVCMNKSDLRGGLFLRSAGERRCVGGNVWGSMRIDDFQIFYKARGPARAAGRLDM